MFHVSQAPAFLQGQAYIVDLRQAQLNFLSSEDQHDSLNGSPLPALTTSDHGTKKQATYLWTLDIMSHMNAIRLSQSSIQTVTSSNLYLRGNKWHMTRGWLA
jgi:hypothetical protein